ncbi:hypothetical protein CRV08_08650 [Halarcobacter ebronensis]|uniref:Uncharacterized protein n=1 Tax=Halarcobacter ebronensis TaxID=1462615 RepID=A0A4Q0YCZ3_9BACT|nr:hypothetical protein [Halarcobacter ebronensis]RXJ68310.1 hypothetical protein CRV08_08650 [Halarcobacter ebronensis]
MILKVIYRYTYVKNNPLKYTDPSGFFFKKLFRAINKVFKAIKKYIKVIIAVVVTVIIAIYAPYLLGFTQSIGLSAMASLTFAQAMVVGAISGFASGFIMTGTLSGAVKGALWGAISAGVAQAIGHAEALRAFKEALGGMGQHIMHGITRAAITKAQGGRWSSGFWSGLAGSALGATMGKLENVHVSIKAVINSIASGLISKVSGGKFANGAVTGAFVYLFNHALDELLNSTKMTASQKQMIKDNYDRTEESIARYKLMAKVRAEDSPLEDVSYVLLPVSKIVVRDAWNFQLRNAATNNQLIVNYLENMPLGPPSPTWIGYGEGLKAIYDHLKDRFSSSNSGYNPNDKSVPK